MNKSYMYIPSIYVYYIAAPTYIYMYVYLIFDYGFLSGDYVIILETSMFKLQVFLFVFLFSFLRYDISGRGLSWCSPCT